MIETKPFHWPHKAPIQLTGGRLKFPKVYTRAPAVYRLDIGVDVYIGKTSEANGLNGRWKNYTRFRHDKDPTTYTNNRIHSHLMNSGGGTASWLTAEDTIFHNGQRLNLSAKNSLSALEGYLIFADGGTLNL